MTRIHINDTLLAHAEIRMVEISVENHEFSKNHTFSSQDISVTVGDFNLNPSALER